VKVSKIQAQVHQNPVGKSYWLAKMKMKSYVDSSILPPEASQSSSAEQS